MAARLDDREGHFEASLSVSNRNKSTCLSCFIAVYILCLFALSVLRQNELEPL